MTAPGDEFRRIQPRELGADDDGPDRIALAVLAGDDIPIDPAGPLYGHLAQGMALGALTPLLLHEPWNSLEHRTFSGRSRSVYDLRITLGRTWGINSSTDWFDVVAKVISGQFFFDAQAVLFAREDAVARGDYAPAELDNLWRRWLIDNDHDTATYNNTRSLVESVIAADDFLRPTFLPADRYTTTTAGFSLAWAVQLARDGMQSGYGNRAEANQMILTARDTAAEVFTSWSEYAVSVLFGVLIYQEADPDELRAAAATLLTVDHSPWRVLPFPTPDTRGAQS